jgi:HSP20 family protein
MNTVVYNSLLRDVANMNAMMNRIFAKDALGYDYARNGGNSNGKNEQPEVNIARLPLDARSSEEAIELTAYLPGVKPEEVEITFEKDELTIKGCFPARVESNGYVRQELFHGAFERKLSFATPVNAEAIEAHFENGVLTLRLPKAETAKPKKIAVLAR